MLDANIQAEILVRSFRDHESVRKIARELGISRKAVKTVIERRCVALGVTRAERSSILDPYKPAIEGLIKDHQAITATAVLQNIRAQGYTGGYSTLKSWVAKKREETDSKSAKEAFLMLEFSPGECAQADWGEFENTFDDCGPVHAFVMVLCYSRLIYVEFTRSEKFEDFLRCHENALDFFNGVPEEIWYDNLTSAVTERMGKLIKFNARFMAYTGYHGFRPQACNKARGNEKGRVENGIKFIRNNFWSGRKFASFDDLCSQVETWYREIGNRREHGATRKIPQLVFENEEKTKLGRLREDPYDTDEVVTYKVTPQFHMTYQTNQYSVPWTLVGHVLTCRIDARNLRFFYHERLVASHARRYSKDNVVTSPNHKEGLLEMKPGAKSDGWQFRVLSAYGENLVEYFKYLSNGSRSIVYETKKLLALATVYGGSILNEVVGEFLGRGLIGADQIEIALKSKFGRHEKPQPLIFRNEVLAKATPQVDLRRYDSFLFKNDDSNTPLIKEKPDNDGEKP
jgi:transposase